MIFPAWIVGPLGRWLVTALALFLSGLLLFHRGMLHERAGWEARRAHAVVEARATEAAAANLGNAAEREALAAARHQKESADAEMAILRAQLAQLPRCVVPRNLVRVLDGAAAAVPATARTAGSAGGPAAHLAADPGPGAVFAAAGAARPAALQSDPAPAGVDAAPVDAAAVLENCAWNRLHVAEPNAQHIEQLQRFYAALRHLINHP